MQFILDCELNVLSFPLKISDNSMQRDQLQNLNQPSFYLVTRLPVSCTCSGQIGMNFFKTYVCYVIISNQLYVPEQIVSPFHLLEHHLNNAETEKGETTATIEMLFASLIVVLRFLASSRHWLNVKCYLSEEMVPIYIFRLKQNFLLFSRSWFLKIRASFE